MSAGPKTSYQLLQEKAANFRTFIEAYSPDAEAQKVIKSFNPQLLVPTIHLSLLPLKQAGKLAETAKAILDRLQVPGDQKEAVLDKIRRYLECFCELSIS